MLILAFLIQSSLAKLLSVIELSRHGARQALLPYPWNKFDWEVGLGEITHEGIIQQYLIGQELRSRYVTPDSPIKGAYNLSHVHIRTTNIHRTFISAQAQMYGFFPEGPQLMVPSNRLNIVPPFATQGLEQVIKTLGDYALPNKYQPVAIYVEEMLNDFVLSAYTKACARMGEIIFETEQGKDYIQKVENYNKNIRSKLAKKLNISELEFKDVPWAADSFENIEFAGFDRKSLIDDELYKQLIEIRNYGNSYLFDNEEGLHLAMSGFFTEVLNTFDEVSKGKSERFLSVYLSHDTQLVGMLRTLGAYDGNGPPFASVFLFELHDVDGVKVVRFFYNDLELFPSFCGKKCELSAFAEFVRSWAVKNISESCLPKGKRNLLSSIQNVNYHGMT